MADDYRVGRVHAPAGPGPRAGVADDAPEILLGQGAGQRFAVGFQRGEDVDLAAPVLARTDAAAVHHQGGAVEAAHGHHGAGHVLVATHHGHHAVVPLGAGHGFDGVGNEVAGGQGKAHPPGAHREGVAHAGGVEDEPHQAGVFQALFDEPGQVVEVHVAGVAFEAGTGNADLGFLQVGFGKAGPVQHGPRRRLTGVLRDGAAVFVEEMGHEDASGRKDKRL
ncbi:MAG: hypothetical protein AVDCRST_MAG56-4915 [uncultured Cytophagales bacterium]|uniref:Uncharacterized protein n=1 Tax=uncultured Cytophagales bacterium TaxID=158755 RepID=A0A6J4JMV6_9SPHI|nr:MAG: hypothetical protein AVDCRST_MAG56-4915 [uncultured Cytophagales bacterium]